MTVAYKALIPVQLMSRPRFTVELCKGDGRTLSLDCVFISPEELEPQENPQDAEAIGRYFVS